MSDEEDDYMSAVFVQPTLNDKPKDTFSSWRKRRLNIKDNNSEKDESHLKKPRSLKVLQEETREKGLSTALPSDNLGFKLMAKMGYQAGEGLGKEKSGRKEPIPIVVKASRSGLGKEAREKERAKLRLKAKAAALKARQKMSAKLMQDYQSRMRNQYHQHTFERDLYKSQKVCHQLDIEEEYDLPLLDYFWPDAVMQKDEKDVLELEVSSDDEDLEGQTAEEKLMSLTAYLREKYFYCLWCAVKYEDENDLQQNCAGDTSRAHDD